MKLSGLGEMVVSGAVAPVRAISGWGGPILRRPMNQNVRGMIPFEYKKKKKRKKKDEIIRSLSFFKR